MRIYQMITKKQLEEWRIAKNLAVVSINIEPSVTIAIQEMYIEAKALRKDNLHLLNRQDLFDKLITYMQVSSEDHYLSEEMEELLEEIRELCDTENINLELNK